MLMNILVAAELAACPAFAVAVGVRMHPDVWRRRLAVIPHLVGRRA